MITPHPCSVPGCGRMLKPHHLMCRGHWVRVPYALRSAVWGAWESYRDGDLSAESLRAVQQGATDAVVAELARVAPAARKGGAA